MPSLCLSHMIWTYVLSLSTKFYHKISNYSSLTHTFINTNALEEESYNTLFTGSLRNLRNIQTPFQPHNRFLLLTEHWKSREILYLEAKKYFYLMMILSTMISTIPNLHWTSVDLSVIMIFEYFCLWMCEKIQTNVLSQK